MQINFNEKQDKIRHPPFTAHFSKSELLLYDNAKPYILAITQKKLLTQTGSFTYLPTSRYFAVYLLFFLVIRIN